MRTYNPASSGAAQKRAAPQLQVRRAIRLFTGNHVTRKLEIWLFIVALGHIAAGVALPFVAFSSGFDLYAERIRESFWGGALMPPEAEAFQRWIVALFGPTVASWGVLMAYLVRAGMRTNDPWPWNALLLSLLVWAPADIAISLMRNFWLHVVIDLVAVLIIVAPALMLRAQKSRKYRIRPTQFQKEQQWI